MCRGRRRYAAWVCLNCGANVPRLMAGTSPMTRHISTIDFPLFVKRLCVAGEVAASCLKELVLLDGSPALSLSSTTWYAGSRFRKQGNGRHDATQGRPGRHLLNNALEQRG